MAPWLNVLNQLVLDAAHLKPAPLVITPTQYISISTSFGTPNFIKFKDARFHLMGC